MHKPLSKTETKRLNEEKAAEYVKEGAHLAFILQDVKDPINVGAFFRIAEGLNAEIILAGSTPQPKDKRVSLAARGLNRKVPWTHEAEFADALKLAKTAGYTVVGAELTEESVPFDTYPYPANTAIVMGNEATGIYKKNLDLLDAHVYIPMLGKGPSLNVHTAGAIIGYQWLSHQARPS